MNTKVLSVIVGPPLLFDTGCDLIRVGAMVGEAAPGYQTILPFRCQE